jgi:fructuronate reductase
MRVPTGARLSLATRDVSHADMLPSYDRAAPPSIVHLGVGSFARAHLGVYADDLSRRGWSALIHGISLRSHTVQDALTPQDCLYTVSEREPDVLLIPRVMASFVQVDTGMQAAVAALSAPSTKLITLTITEKGYEVDPGELTNPALPVSAAGALALSLQARRQSRTGPPIVVAMDNLQGNGDALRRCVIQMAGQLDPDLASWITDEVRFPNSVVDRMVPAATEQDFTDVQAQLGLVDLAAVVCEHHRSWVIESVDGLPPLADAGVHVVDSVVPFEQRKLWLLNGPHSAFAYAGLLTGYATIAEAAADPMISAFVAELVHDTLEVADLPASLDQAGFARETLHRFANPNLRHACAQVGADGSQKLPQRLLPVVEIRRRHGLDTTRFATVIAMWLAAVTGVPVQGTMLAPVDDPLASALRVAVASEDFHQVSGVALGHHPDTGFISQVAAQLSAVVRRGPAVLGADPR